MVELIKLRYKLNREYFFVSSIFFKDITEMQKKIFFACYSFLKVTSFFCILFMVEMVLLRNKAEYYLFSIGHSLLFLTSLFYFTNVSESENSKTHIKDFLMSSSFNSSEKLLNRKKLSFIIFYEASFISFTVWIVVIPFFSKMSLLNIGIAFALTISNLLNVFVSTYYSRKKTGSNYWFVNYILVGIVSFGIIQFWNYFKLDANFTTIEINKKLIYFMIFGFVYQVITSSFSFIDFKVKNQTIGGLTGDFIEKYLSKSAVVYAFPIVFLNIIHISQLSKVLIILAVISLFVMPNIMSLKFLNYFKMVGASRNILLKYGQITTLFQIGLSLMMGFLCRINGTNLFLMVILLILLMNIRIWCAILLSSSKYEDGQKIDYYALATFGPIMVICALAFFWR